MRAWCRCGCQTVRLFATIFFIEIDCLEYWVTLLAYVKIGEFPGLGLERWYLA